jgi:hypothetical protein
VEFWQSSPAKALAKTTPRPINGTFLELFHHFGEGSAGRVIARLHLQVGTGNQKVSTCLVRRAGLGTVFDTNTSFLDTYEWKESTETRLDPRVEVVGDTEVGML